MTTRTLFPSMVCALALRSPLTSSSPRAEEPVSFAKDIQPIFESELLVVPNSSDITLRNST